MRPLRLTIRAFGPYPGEETVEFSALAPYGLFVVAGPTGSGKTTIFDAMVFALYGTVPGQRLAGETRSHHAPPGVEPMVSFEFEAQGERYRATRTPAFDRPKRRGSGVTSVQPTAALAVWRSGRWEPSCTGLHAVREAVVECIGLDAEQFQRVILLPQGSFEQFLVARGDERRPLLRRLFGSGIFDRAVLALKDAAATAGRDAAAVQQGVEQHQFLAADHLEQAERCLGLALAGGIGVDDTGAEPSGAVGSDLDERLHLVESAVGAGKSELDQAERDEQAAVAAVAAAEELGRRWRLRAERQDRAAAFDREAGGRDAERLVLGAARRAIPVLDAERSAAAACSELHRSSVERQRADAVLSARLEALEIAANLDDVPALRRALAGEQRRAEGLARLRKDWDEATERHQRARRQAEQAQADLDGASDLVRQCESEHDDVSVELVETAGKAEALPSALESLQALRTRRRRRSELDAVVERCLALRERAARETDAYDALVQAYLAATAPRLAARLVDGEPCSVCGSAIHPAPAERSATDRDVSPAEIEAQQERMTSACGERDQQLGVLSALRAELPGGEDQTVAELDAQVAAACSVVAEAESAVERCSQLEQLRTSLIVRRDSAVDATRAATGHHAAAVARVEAVEDEVQRLEQALAGAGPHASDPEGRLRGIVSAEDALDEREEALTSERDHRGRASLLQEAAAAVLTESGFASADEARRAAIDPAALAQREQALRAWDDERREIQILLSEDQLDVPDHPPETDSLRATVDRARQRRQAFAHRQATASTHARAAHAALVAIGDQLPVVQETVRRAELARTVYERCAGKLTPNVPLENWVLGVELDRVAEAANVHLTAMTGGRYRLQRAAGPVDARSGAGLDLEVSDAHTGTTRRPWSLSGGERFQASLALALGLADVATSGTAATSRTLDALFVDEGFGSLDANALDQAIAALDRLRQHGRQIGVITHVEAMKAALAVGIEVEPLPGGQGSRIVQPLLR